MPTVSATATIDDDGVVRGLRTMGESFEQVGEEADVASGRLEEFEESIQENVSVTERFTDAQQELAEEGREMVATLDRQADAMEQMEARQTRLNTSSSKYNQILFSSGDLVQDLQFGVKGASNNIAFMAEQMAEVQSQGQSFKQVLGGIFSALKGPAGIILAIQTLLVLGPKLAEWFSSRTEEASRLNEELSSAADSMLAFSEDIAGFEVETLQQAEEVREQIEGQIEAREEGLSALRSLLEVDQARGAQKAQLSRQTRQQAQQARERFGLEEATTEEIRSQIAEQERQVSGLEELLTKAKNMVSSRKASQEIEQLLNETVAEQNEKKEEQAGQQEKFTDSLIKAQEVQNEILESQDDISFDEQVFFEAAPLIRNVENAARAIDEGLVSNLKETSDVLGFLQEERKTASGERLRQINALIQRYRDLQSELQRAGTEGQKAFSDQLESISDVQNLLSGGAFDSIQKVETAIGFLQQRLREATSSDERDRIRALISTLEGVRDEMKGAGQEAQTFEAAIESLNAQRMLAQALTQQFTKLGEAIGQGENVMKAFGDTALGVLASVGQAMGKQLIAQGSALVASALIPGQQGNAAAGAALIAAGSSLIAASSALQSTIGGGSDDSGDSAESEPDRREGGGEAGFAPGRQSGGPVQGGRLYETHGLGRREFFVPGTDGAIATGPQLQRATRGQRSEQTVRVETENRIEGEISGPDLFELNTRLKEVESFKESFAEQ